MQFSIDVDPRQTEVWGSTLWLDTGRVAHGRRTGIKMIDQEVSDFASDECFSGEAVGAWHCTGLSSFCWGLDEQE
jgi:hypothetical protein